VGEGSDPKLERQIELAKIAAKFKQLELEIGHDISREHARRLEQRKLREKYSRDISKIRDLVMRTLPVSERKNWTGNAEFDLDTKELVFTNTHKIESFGGKVVTRIKEKDLKRHKTNAESIVRRIQLGNKAYELHKKEQYEKRAREARKKELERLAREEEKKAREEYLKKNPYPEWEKEAIPPEKDNNFDIFGEW
jgi:Asp-tRNA(Asn)/Glu-tRNA(Gln) amidotransferase A subunit family amidase